jgi:cell division protein ZapA (FtsZ GTPase activity inhibitor)
LYGTQEKGENIMEKNKVKLNICGVDYFINTDDDVKYVQELGDELDLRLNKLMRENARISVTQAAVLAALEYADLAKKEEQSAENLRSQIQEYLEDAARAKTNAEVSRREAERLGKELATLRARFQGN